MSGMETKQNKAEKGKLLQLQSGKLNLET